MPKTLIERAAEGDQASGRILATLINTDRLAMTHMFPNTSAYTAEDAQRLAIILSAYTPSLATADKPKVTEQRQETDVRKVVATEQERVEQVAADALTRELGAGEVQADAASKSSPSTKSPVFSRVIS